MSTNRVITTKEIEKSLAWIEAFFKAADTKDVQHMITDFFYPDGTLAFNDKTPIKGHDALITHFKEFYRPFSNMKHTIEHFDVLPNRIYAQVKFETVMKNDPEQKTITILAFNSVQKNIDEDKASFYHVYGNILPLEQGIKIFS